LQQKGLVEGYPDGEFKGNRTLTRYEFAVVTARLYDTLVAQLGEGGSAPPDVDAILQRLEDEFRPDIEELRSMLENHDERLSEMEAAFGGLSTRIDSTEKAIAGRLGNTKITTDLRTRFEYINQDEDEKDPTKRARIRLRVKGEGNVNPEIKGTFRVSSGGTSEVTSTNESLEDFFELDPFQIDQAYLTYGPMNDAGIQDWTLTAGKFAPNWVSTLITMDSDVNVEGLGENFFRYDDHWRLNLAQLVPAKAGFMLVNQLGYKDLITKGVDLYGTYTYMDPDAFFWLRDSVDSTSKNFDKILKNQIEFSSIAIDSDFSQVEGIAKIQLNTLFHDDYPLAFTANYLESNFDQAPGAERLKYKAAYANLTGGTLSQPGDWKWWGEWGRIQSNAVITAWTDSDRGEGNTNFIAGGLGYQWMENVELDLTYIDHERHFPEDSPVGFGRLQLDAVAKF
ncbi:MAG: putative porin, partial [bacterium]